MAPPNLFEDRQFPLAEDELASLEVRLISVDQLAFMHPRDNYLPVFEKHIEFIRSAAVLYISNQCRGFEIRYYIPRPLSECRKRNELRLLAVNTASDVRNLIRNILSIHFVCERRCGNFWSELDLISLEEQNTSAIFLVKRIARCYICNLLHSSRNLNVL